MKFESIWIISAFEVFRIFCKLCKYTYINRYQNMIEFDVRIVKIEVDFPICRMFVLEMNHEIPGQSFAIFEQAFL